MSLGIGIIDDEILDVNLDNSGGIDNLVGEYNKYKYDFYVDSTGFKRILISKLGAKWQSYSKFLKANSAISFQTPDTDNYNIWTLAKTMKAGWLFRLPVWGRHGNGYIFNSDYISEEEAKIEVEKYFGHNIEINKTFKFDPGALDKVWIKNCCAIGLSASFVEPMEASSIGTSIQQSFLLMHRLANYDELTIDRYNKSVNTILDNIRDFVALHYITNKKDTEFWKDVAEMPIPDTLADRLEIWKHKLPIGEDFKSQSDYSLFKEHNFTMVLQGLGLFNADSIKKEYNALESSVHIHADKLLTNIRHYEKTMPAVTHKEYIKKIRESK
jgi:tryptophan halogenase